MLRNIRWLWSTSSSIFKGNGFASRARRFLFLLRAMWAYDSVLPLIDAPTESPLGRLLKERPETIGAIIWPYQCATWDTKTRLSRIRAHFDEVAIIGSPINFGVSEAIPLLNLSTIRKDLHVLIDQPEWFMREGQLTLNLFIGEIRMFSLVFSLTRENDELVATIGAVQGRDIEGALDEYRELTKACNGMRPRDFLFELFRMLCGLLGVKKILAVTDETRHHRSKYFGAAATKKFSTNYNEIWEDRGGNRYGQEFYRFDVRRKQKELSEVSAKKRAMYRRRFEMLVSLETQFEESYRKLRSTRNTPLNPD